MATETICPDAPTQPRAFGSRKADFPNAGQLAYAEKTSGAATVEGGLIGVAPSPTGPPVQNVGAKRTIWPPITEETRSHVTTAQAAYHLNRAQQTLRGWACNEDGPLRPIRINSRFAWPVAEIKRLLGVAQEAGAAS